MMQESEIKKDPTKRIRPRRPFVLRIIFWLFAFWALLGWLRFARALMVRSLILEILGTGYFYMLLIAGLINGLGALPVLWGLLQGAWWTLPLIWVMAIIYPGLYWFERLALWADPNAGRNWPLMLMLTLLWFGLVAWASWSKRSRRYFKQDVEGNQR